MDVKTLQLELSAMGVDPGAADGVFGPLTRAALATVLSGAGIGRWRNWSWANGRGLRKFGRQFILAQLDPLRAPDMARIPGNGREANPGDISVAAREQTDRAHRVLGGHDAALGSVAWHVLGCGC